MKILCFAALFIIQIFSHMEAMDGQSSYPYLSGYTWGFFCDWKLIDEDYGSRAESFDPHQVQLGDTVFVDLRRMEEFSANYLPKIKDKIILITSNYGFDADHSIPEPFEYLLKEEKIGAWFGQNVCQQGLDKLIPLPIGIANPHWEHGNIEILSQLIEIARTNKERPILNYLNFTFRKERVDCIEHFQKMGAQFEANKSFMNYLYDLSDSIFVVSPPGNGIDCHRTWEALLMGCYPIVKSSTLNSLYEQLPVVIVEDWKEVTEEFLKTKAEEFKNKTWAYEKLYAPYWFDKVSKLQQQMRQQMQRVPFVDSFLPYYHCDENNLLVKLAQELYQAFTYTDPDAPYLIPKKIHFIWLGSPLPEGCAQLIDTWKAIHPSWEVKVWDDDDAAQFGLKNQLAFDAARNFGEKSDIFRYEILDRYGGVYADTDFECLQSLDQIHQSCEFYTSMIGVEGVHSLLNGLVGSRPNHPVMKACIQNIRSGPGDHDSARIFEASGPYLFTKMFLAYTHSVDKGQTVVLPPSFFYSFPSQFREMQDREEIKKKFVRPESLLIHYWESRWNKNG